MSNQVKTLDKRKPAYFECFTDVLASQVTRKNFQLLIRLNNKNEQLEAEYSSPLLFILIISCFVSFLQSANLKEITYGKKESLFDGACLDDCCSC